MTEIFKVSGKSEPKLVAGAIAICIRNNQNIELHAIGAAAVNQAVKSIALARSFVAPEDIELASFPSFLQLNFKDTETIGIVIAICKF